MLDCAKLWRSEVPVTRIENPRVGGSIPPPGTIKNSDKTRLVRVLLFLTFSLLPLPRKLSPSAIGKSGMIDPSASHSHLTCAGFINVTTPMRIYLMTGFGFSKLPFL